jgi:hypothetical protein
MYYWDVFVSYSASDKTRAEEVATALRGYGLRVWLDSQRIAAGDQILTRISEGIDKSRWLVQIYSSGSAGGSEWSRVETHAMLHAEIVTRTTRVVALLLDPAEQCAIPPELLDKRHVLATDHAALARLATQLKRWRVPADFLQRLRDAPVGIDRLTEGTLLTWDSIVEPIVTPLMPSEIQRPPLARAGRQAERLSDFLLDVKRKPAQGVLHSAVVIGEAGVGKTILCRKSCHGLAASGNIVPVHIPLGEWHTDEDWEAMVSRQIDSGVDWSEFAAIIKEEGLPVMFFLDGLNELEPGRIDHAWAWLRDFASTHPTFAFLTTRPMAFLATSWQGQQVQYYRLDWWTDEQLATYVEVNGSQDSLEGLSEDALTSLHLPLIAFLFTFVIPLEARARAESIGLAEAFRLLLENATQGDKWAASVGSYWAQRSPMRAIRGIAYRMTERRVVQAGMALMEEVLPEDERPQAADLLDALCLAGVLRGSGGRPGVPSSRLFTFFHQAFQDYLTAQDMLARGSLTFPDNTSADAFWNSVPSFLIQGLEDSAAQLKFTLDFLRQPSPDYLMAARLIPRNRDPGLRQRAATHVVRELVENLAEPDLYEFSIDAFRETGLAGKNALRQSLSDVEQLRRTFTEFERHLVPGGYADQPNESGWRPLGRSMYVLGEIGDDWIARQLSQHFSKVRSLHLLYHAGEALLELARRATDEPSRDVVRRAADRLGESSIGDALTRAQRVAVDLVSGEFVPPEESVREMRGFLHDRSDNGSSHFGDEFWRRAHGIEAFGLLAATEDCRDEFTRLFLSEDRANYEGHPVRGYRLVQSSVLKAAMRCLAREPHGSPELASWRPLVEVAFMSERVAENGWACRFVEEILMGWFSSGSDVGWLREWVDSRELGGAGTKRAILNTLRRIQY